MSARDRVREAGGAELLERLDHLDGIRHERPAPPRRPPPPRIGDRIDADVVVAGGGLWSLLAPLLALRGLSVIVLDRARAASAHREWNASGPELRALVDAGLVDDRELEELVLARYRRGTCRFVSGGSYPVYGVLDHAVDARRLLELGRSQCERRGVRVLDRHTVISHATGPAGVRFEIENEGRRVELTSRIMVDARGAASPFASADLVCPTVGGVVTGLAEGESPDVIDRDTGEILATTEGIEDGRQHIWEAFPGRPGETTVYLFYYARKADGGSLAELYARFFDRLPMYKRGDMRLVRPTFGFIPGWSRLTPRPSAHHPRVILVGDAAARHSPLTYCGFGSALRSFASTADDVVARLAEGGPSPAAEAPIHALTGALAHVMTSRAFGGMELDRLLDAAFRTLHELGNEVYAGLLRDELSPRDFTRFLRCTARRHPAVWAKVLRGLGPVTASRWGAGLLRRAAFARI